MKKFMVRGLVEDVPAAFYLVELCFLLSYEDVGARLGSLFVASPLTNNLGSYMLLPSASILA